MRYDISVDLPLSEEYWLVHDTSSTETNRY